MNITKNRMNHIKYRADIDGLRAIAIILVIGYHAFPGIFQGGYIGVDIFFVISGFLISTIIFGNLSRKSFSYLEFYSRRVKRIFPALLLVVFFNWLVGWFILFPTEFNQLGKHIAGGIGFISNFILWNEHGYFDSSSEVKPLLHLWSLGIEEQFYIFWPLLLGVLWKNKYNFLAITISVAFISFSANIYTLYYLSSNSAFYLPINRFWELMIGGVLAYITLHPNKSQQKSKNYLHLQSILGCMLIIVSLVYLDQERSYPGWWALLPTTGAFFIIFSPGSWVNDNLLSNRVLVYIGLISYPLYLWHWSLLSFLHILEFHDWRVTCGTVFLSFIMASLTYEFIEKNIKTGKSINITNILISLSFVFFCIGLSTSFGIFTPRNNTTAMNLATEAVGDWEYPEGLHSIKINHIKVYTKKGAKEKVLFFGDSHIEQYAPRIIQLINQNPMNIKTVVFATRGGCPPIPNVYEDKHPSCNFNYKNTIINYALSADIDSVVIGTSWGYLIEDSDFPGNQYHYYYLLNGEKIFFDINGINYALKSFEDLILRISRHKKVYLILDNPSGSSFDPKTFFTGNRINGIIDNTVSFKQYNKKQAEMRTIMIEIAQRTNAIIIDPVKHFCTNNLCRVSLDNGKPIYKDSSHIRASYVKNFVDYIDLTVQK